MNFGAKLQEIRKVKKISQQKLAEKTGYSQQTISAYECDAVVPNIIAANKIAQALGVDVSELLSSA
jgi:transcriptional regulator with XRE-family HTH domain